MLLVSAPAYALAQAAWILRLLIWHDDGSFDRPKASRARNGRRRWRRTGGLAAKPS
jgi:hypothetical protein